MEETLYYLCKADDWTHDDNFKGSPMDLADGFIHLSTQSKLADVAKKFFHGEKDVLLITLKTNSLQGKIEWIQSKRTGGVYAHLFGTIPADAVLTIEPLEQDAEQHLILPKHLNNS